MTTATQLADIRAAVHAFDFKRLFIEELGWNRAPAQPLYVAVEGVTYALRAVAQKRGVVIYACAPDAAGGIPDYTTRKKIEAEVTKQVHEHLIIFTDEAHSRQIWQWVKRVAGRGPAYREHVYSAGQTGEALVQRLAQMMFDLEDEETASLLTVTERMTSALDVERVTKRFYDRFSKEHTRFMATISGIADEELRRWYASLMLNRLMFTYFIQKKGFLDGNPTYLRDRLRLVRERRGPDQFHTFYRYFLRRLFHDGLGKAEAERAPDLEALLGRVPYLNGGLFEVHAIERAHPDLDIGDEAFEHVFAFFDEYRWHLDDRPLQHDNEINPDVLGYIFEKYINQKQMGAYYTKEDITDYIGKNTILPYLFDAAREKCKIAFAPEGEVWRLLRDDPDRYLYDAVQQGVDEPLPPEISAGLADVSQRTGWNRPAPQPFALPTETWREHIARRQRCHELRAKLANGEVTAINDLITYNLDIRRFAQDVIEQCEGPELLRAFWRALTTVTVLDPTCGSGAFLFAALNILEPLYAACLDRMAAFVAGFESAGKSAAGSDFREILARVKQHPNRRYFILKSIIIANLYGVDIMEEACEIAKLRLFLKLVAQVEDVAQLEPLPDIDFNIRAGNTLVGFATLDAVRQAMTYDTAGRTRKLLLDPQDEAALARINENAEIAGRAYQMFQRMQSEERMDAAAFRAAKDDLKRKLSALRDELDRYLAREYGIAAQDDLFAFEPWRASHQPFHWFVEFYEIVQERGGFDVIIGNPPYVSSRSVPYSFARQYNAYFSDLYAYVVERSIVLAQKRSRVGMIVPLSLTFSEDFGILRSDVCAFGTAWVSSFDNIPAALFSGVSQRCTIWIGAHSTTASACVTQLYRWRSEYRPNLVPNLNYVCATLREVATRGIPKVASDRLWHLFNRVSASKPQSRTFDSQRSKEQMVVWYSQTARNFVSAYIEEPPCLDAESLKPVQGSPGGGIPFSSPDTAFAAFVALAGDVFFWYWLVQGDGFHITHRTIADYLAFLGSVSHSGLSYLAALGEMLHARRYETLVFKKNAGKFVGNYNFHNISSLTRRADLLLLAELGLTGSEALALQDYVQRVLSINTFAGEKSIPIEVKEMFPAAPINQDKQALVYDEIDRVLAEHYGFTDEELDFILNYDIKYRMGQESGAGEGSGGEGEGEE